MCVAGAVSLQVAAAGGSGRQGGEGLQAGQEPAERGEGVRGVLPEQPRAGGHAAPRPRAEAHGTDCYAPGIVLGEKALATAKKAADLDKEHAACQLYAALLAEPVDMAGGKACPEGLFKAAKAVEECVDRAVEAGPEWRAPLVVEGCATGSVSSARLTLRYALTYAHAAYLTHPRASGSEN
eukprot:1187186-Prorocentrum_minimum.AAC.1